MLHQSDHARGKETTRQAFCAGAVALTIMDIDLSKGFTAASDKIELGVIPAEAILTRAVIIGEGLGAITADVGLMSGEFGDNDDTRTVADEIFNGVSVNDNEAEAPVLGLLALGRSNKHRAFGATLSGNVAAGAGKKLTILVESTY